MNETRINLLLFDFDGTLVNTTPLILRAFRATWESVFGFVYDDSRYINTFGMLLPKAMKLLTEQSIVEGLVARPDDLAAFLADKEEELTRVYREFNRQWHDEMIEPIPGVEEALGELKSRKFAMGVVSSKMRAGLSRGLNIYQLTRLFDVIIAGDDCENHKPHPEPVLRAIERVGAAPGETVYVGDSPHDIVAGRAAGVRTAAAMWGPFPRIELESLRPDYVLDDPGELLTTFSR